MSYRVTTQMTQNLFLGDMQRSLNSLLDLQKQLVTQKRYNKPSDNPAAVARALSIDTAITENVQYRANLNDAKSWLKNTDSALGQMTDLWQRIRELAVYAGNGALEGVDMQAIAVELEELKKELMSVANSSIEGRALFAGAMTCKTPFYMDDQGNVHYVGSSHSLLWEVETKQVGKVSLTGTEVFPQDEVQNVLNSFEVPLDFEWNGRDEILEFKVGWRTVKVRLPEKWKDEHLDTVADPSDYNRFRDPMDDEVGGGYSLDEIAELINSSVSMGDAQKILSVKVVKDMSRGVQYLSITSHTGEPVRLTSWPETDAQALAQGIKGIGYGPAGRTVAADGNLTLRFGEITYSVDVKAGETMQQICDKVAAACDGKIWAAVKQNNTASPAMEWIDFVARTPGTLFSIEATGGASALFSDLGIATSSAKTGGGYELTSTVPPTGFVTVNNSETLWISVGDEYISVPVAGGTNVSGMAAAINQAVAAAIQAADDMGLTTAFGVMNNAVMPPTPDPWLVADVVNGRLVLDHPSQSIRVTADGSSSLLFGGGIESTAKKSGDAYSMVGQKIPVPVTFPGYGAVSVEIGGATLYRTYTGGESLEDVADDLQTELQALGLLKGFTATVTVKDGLDENGVAVQWLEISSDTAFSIKATGDAAGAFDKAYVASQVINKNSDHSHIDFASFMGIETSPKTIEVPIDWTADTTVSPLDLKFVSGSNKAEVYIADAANLTLEELVGRINATCGTWLEAILETDVSDGTDPLDPLWNSQDNKEVATQRIVFRTRDGAPLTIYDGQKAGAATGDYAAELGISTALRSNYDQIIAYPSDGTGPFDENMPAQLEVRVGGDVYLVKVCNQFCWNAALVSRAIVTQVNEQYGGKLLDYDAFGYDFQTTTQANFYDPTNTWSGDFAIFTTTGEPLEILDRPYGDPRYSDYTGGIAMRIGIQAGLVSTPVQADVAVANPGNIRIESMGRSVDVPVLAGDNLYDIANRIRDMTGDWLDVSFWDNDMTDNANAGLVQLAITAKDGSPVTIYDSAGLNAPGFGLNTDLRTGDLAAWSPQAGDTLTLSIGGVVHTIDLWDTVTPPGTGQPTVNNVEELAEMINTRFQEQSIRATVLNENGVKTLVLTSPRGEKIELVNAPAALAMTDGTNPPATTGVISPQRGGQGGPYNQQVVRRTASTRKETDFFGVLNDLIAAVKAEDRDAISDFLLAKLDKWGDTLLKNRAQAGALYNRYDATETRLKSTNVNLTELYDNVIGVDLTEIVTQLQMAQSVYQASLAVIAQIVRPSLVDFLR